MDFVEYIFRTDSAWRISAEERNMVREINEFFEIDDLPYYLTDFVRESVREFHFGREREVSRVVSFPQVICRDDQIPHMTAIEPTLILLAQEPFKSANDEFRNALQHYRKQEYADCLAKCGSAFESVMKIICERKGWKYKQTDTASTLLKTVIEQLELPSFFEQPLLIVATLRNRLSSSHGAGTQVRSVSQGVAKFAINSTAAGILLLVEDTSQLIKKNK